MVVEKREEKGRGEVERGTEGVGWQRGNENERAGEGWETDRAHKGGKEMVSARQTEQGVDEGAVESSLEEKKGPRRQ